MLIKDEMLFTDDKRQWVQCQNFHQVTAHTMGPKSTEDGHKKRKIYSLTVSINSNSNSYFKQKSYSILESHTNILVSLTTIDINFEYQIFKTNNRYIVHINTINIFIWFGNQFKYINDF